MNIRYTDSQVYLDTPDVSAVGPIARLAQRGIESTGLREPMAVPRPDDVVAFDRSFVVSTQSGPLEVLPNSAAYVGRPCDLSLREQASNLWHLIQAK